MSEATSATPGAKTCCGWPEMGVCPDCPDPEAVAWGKTHPPEILKVAPGVGILPFAGSGDLTDPRLYSMWLQKEMYRFYVDSHDALLAERGVTREQLLRAARTMDTDDGTGRNADHVWSAITQALSGQLVS